MCDLYKNQAVALATKTDHEASPACLTIGRPDARVRVIDRETSEWTSTVDPPSQEECLSQVEKMPQHVDAISSVANGALQTPD